MSVELISTPNPHLIPGYTGFCPQYKYRIGNTYASTTHKLLLDPTVSHAEKLVLSDRTVHDYQAQRPSDRDINLVNERHKKGDVIYKHPLVPGYEEGLGLNDLQETAARPPSAAAALMKFFYNEEQNLWSRRNPRHAIPTENQEFNHGRRLRKPSSFIPRKNELFGQRYGVQATEALSEFTQLSQKKEEALFRLHRQGAMQDGNWEPRNLDDRQILKSEYKLPLLPVRPECLGVLRNKPATDTPVCSKFQETSPYFMVITDPEKYLKQGFAGHVPCSYAAFGKTSQAMTNSALSEFTLNNNRRLSTEWAPVSLARPEPPMVVPAAEIYLKEIGQLPNYAGHIPGAIFRFGKTYGNDTRDAKRWLRGDFST